MVYEFTANPSYGRPTSEIVPEDDSAVCTWNDVFKVDSLSSVNVKSASIVPPDKCGKRRESRRNLQKPIRGPDLFGWREIQISKQTVLSGGPLPVRLRGSSPGPGAEISGIPLRGSGR